MALPQQIRSGTVMRRSTAREKVARWSATHLASLLEDIQDQLDELAAANAGNGDVHAFASKATVDRSQKIRGAITKLRKAMT